MFSYPGSSHFACIAAIISTLTVLAAAPVLAAEKLEYGPAEPWVAAVEPAKPDAAYEGAPAQIVLQNMQIRFSPDGSTTYYSEVAIRIQTTAGLQFAQSYVTWNPATDVATVNKVHILRDGKVIDVLARGETFTTVRREQNLDKAMLDGYLTGVLQPEGLQVGDTLVMGSSIKRRDPVFGGRGEAILSGLSAIPVARQVVRATWDTSQPIQWRQSDELKGKIVKTGVQETYVSERNKVLPAEVQNSAPARYNQIGFVAFSQFRSWEEVSSLMAPLYTQAAMLPPDSPLHKEVATIRAASNDPKVQAAMALKLVQTQVRYVFLGMNLGGYVPAEADVTWQRRFGDCKGKTALLIALLRELGIKAEAALVNSGGGDGLDEHLPAIELFDHVIVRVEIDGKTYWLDGTRLGDRDLDSLQPPHVRWALPVTTTGAALEAVPMLPPEKPIEDKFIRLDASAGLDVPARARIETIFRGDFAVQFDAAFQALPVGERDKALKAYWAEQYNWIDPRKVSANFDPVTGEERVTMEGMATMEWSAGKDGKTWRYLTDILSIGWSSGVSRDKGPNKAAPVVIGFPYYERTRQEIILPKGGKDFTVEGDAVEKTLGGSEFRRQVELQGATLTLEASRRALVPEISYKDAKAAEPVLTELWKKDVFLIAPKSYRKDREGKAKSVISSSGDAKSAEELAQKGAQLIQQNRMDEALPVLNKALKLEPTQVTALIARGTIFLSRGNYAAGRADLDLAIRTDPNQWTALNALGAAYQDEFRTQDAIDAYTRAIEIYPNNLYALENRAHAYVQLRQYDKARLDAESARELDGDSQTVVSLRSGIAMAERKRDEARKIIEEAIAANPGDADLRSMLPGLLMNCAFIDAETCDASRAEAVKAYDKLIADKPTLAAYVLRAQARPETDRAGALEDLDTAIKMDETSGWPLMVKARMLIEDKAYDKAMPLIEEAISLTPKDIDGRGLRAQVYLKTGRRDLAVAEYAAIKRDYPKSFMVYNLSCWDLATHDAELEMALADCETGLGMSPKSMQMLDSRAFVKLRLGRYDEAIADYDSALALSPDVAASLYGRGVAKLRNGDKAGGEADLKAARQTWYKIDEEFAEYGVTP